MVLVAIFDANLRAFGNVLPSNQNRPKNIVLVCESPDGLRAPKIFRKEFRKWTIVHFDILAKHGICRVSLCAIRISCQISGEIIRISIDGDVVLLMLRPVAAGAILEGNFFVWFSHAIDWNHYENC